MYQAGDRPEPRSGHCRMIAIALRGPPMPETPCDLRHGGIIFILHDDIPALRSSKPPPYFAG
jgi:hypothetical protein